ncbi:Nitric oxide synthase-interacting protein [Gracilariopsis chorda]|uniref:Nitric oxide synthase-interacting protein n=1 Tax=Gracilariopsis chorda TaxID=448386 RepID=A0A2V3IGK4_9FLOR|nr:Nitric oxide synthase-interacting protein [Gracilariopsis chorda]|eukprot:PXF41211.1 Nitric oxide synthase-interacting protein [Gracilariopsis chorda]
MTRQSKGNTDGAVFTYHERRNMKHGSKRMRLPGAAMKQWNHCALSLVGATDPVLTAEGVLYDREAIVLNLLHQKETARKELMAEKAEEQKKAKEDAQRYAEQKAKLEKSFVEEQEAVHTQLKKDSEQPLDEEHKRTNFWLPSDDKLVTVDSRPRKKRRKEKMCLRTVCPVTHQPLKARDLIALKPMRVKKGSSQQDGADSEPTQSYAPTAGTEYMCPVCHTVLVNSSKPVALRTGTVLCASCVNKFVLKSGRDPVTEVEIDVKTDVIAVHNAGTGFAGSTPEDCSSKEARLYRPSVR